MAICLRTKLLLVLLSALRFAAAVERVCCADAVYRFTIDLKNTCKNVNVGEYGISDTSCWMTLFPPPHEQGIFLETVQQVDILEIGPPPHFSIMARHTVPGPLVDGDVIEYKSVVGNGGNSPNAIQVTVTAETGDGTSVMNFWGMAFQNSCILPVLPQGATIGWTDLAISCNELTAGRGSWMTNGSMSGKGKGSRGDYGR